MDQNNLMDDIWNSLIQKETDPLDELLDSDSIDEEENIIINLKTSKSKDKIKRISKDKASSNLGKMAFKKRKLSKPNLCVPVKNVLTKESMGIINTEKKLLMLPVTSKEDNTFVSSVDESLKKDDKSNLSLLTTPEGLQKPCATVEPEQCKDVEPDSQTKSEGVLLTNQNVRSSPVNSFEAIKAGGALIDLHNKENSENSVKAFQSSEIIDISSPINETVIEETLSELVDSTGISEELKIETETSTQEIFDVDQIFKDIKEYEQPLLEVAEEVIIDTEVSQDDGILIMEGEHQVKLNHNDIMNVIGIPKDSRQFCTDSEDIGTDNWKKNQDQKEISLLRNQFNTLCSQSKLNFDKNQSSALTNNQQLLSPYDNNGECLLDQRQDSYTYNEIKLTRLLSAEINGDEESDDDHRHPNKQFAKGGKFPAFRAQTIDETKSDGGEESEVPSPASQTDSNTLEVSPLSINSQPVNNSPARVNSQDCTPEKKCELKSDISPPPISVKQGKSLRTSSLQLPEVSVSLSYMTDLGNLNDYHLNTDKNNPKGMCEPPDIILHFKTVIHHMKFYLFQQELYTLYITTENILETDPVPYPPTVLVSPPINGHVRCPCSYCVNLFLNLDRNYKTLFTMRSSRICTEIDKKRMLSKIYLEIEQSKLEDDKLLKSIEETMPTTNIQSTSKDDPKEVKQEDNSREKLLSKENNEPIQQMEDNTPDCSSTNPSEEILEEKNDYSSLPPKKRKAFSVSTELTRQESSDFESSGNKKKCKIIIEKDSNVFCSTNKCEELKCNSASVKQPETSVVVKEGCSIVENEQTVKISLTKNFSLDNLQSQDGNDILQKSGKSRHEKCHKHHKRSKEERRLRKERKRLKRQKKEEEMKNRSNF